ncbi:MRP-L47-domain-containing protein, partial [Auriscalpium vulgare]
GARRPHLGIPVNPNHGLYAFFRKKIKDDKETYETLEDADGLLSSAGRSWSAAELRRKSFRDLHTLWYVLLRERNLLSSQWEEMRRITGAPGAVGGGLGRHEIKCRKSMARIKYVINERRLAYEGAIEIFEDQKRAARGERQRGKRQSRRDIIIHKRKVTRTKLME